MKPLTLAGIVGLWMLIGAAGWLVMAVESSESDDELLVNTARFEDSDTSSEDSSSQRTIAKPEATTIEIPTVAKPANEVTTSKPDKAKERTVTDPSLEIVESKDTSLEDGRSVDSVDIQGKGKLTLDAGTVTVAYDFKVNNPVSAPKTTLVLSGSGDISGTVAVNKLEITAGTRRITSGSHVRSTRSGNAKPGQEGFYVAAGATVIIEKGASVTTTAAYGFRIDGTLVIDGGTFNCSFSNGNGKTTNQTWGEGSLLDVRSGVFKATGDASFVPASIMLSGGKIDVTDDIWNTGASLDMSGGSIENKRWGGQFALTGNVNISGGELLVHGNSSRGLIINKDADVTANGGRIVLFGGIMKFYETAALNEVEVQNTCTVHKTSSTDASLYINGGMTFVKGKTFNAGVYNVVVSGMNDNKGIYTPEEYQYVEPRVSKQYSPVRRGGGLQRSTIKPTYSR